MRLLRITIGGYRNITRTTIDLEGITALVSPNNYGKTNLLNAIEFASEFINESPRTRSLMMSSSALVPLVSAIEDENFYFEMILENTDINEAYRFTKYSFEFSWIKDNETGQRIVNETLDIGHKLGARWTTYLKRDEGKYRKSYDTRSFRKITLDDNQLAIDVLTAMEDIDINPVIRSIKQMGFIVLSSLDARNRFNAVPIDFYPALKNSMNDEDLPRALYSLKESHPKKFQDFLSAVHTLFPQFNTVGLQTYESKPEEKNALTEALIDNQEEDEGDDVPFRIKDEIYRLLIKSDYLNQPLDISRMSAGTQRLFWLIASTIFASLENVTCVGVEEVETSIHPKMMKMLLEILNDNRGDASLLLTSHSPYLIQYLKPQHIYIGVPNNEGLAMFKRIKKNGIKKINEAAYERGMSFGEYLFELMSSGEDGERVLLRWLEE